MVKRKLYSIISKHERELYKLANGFDPNQVDDLVQEAYLQLIKILKKQGEKPWAYLKVAAKNAMLNYLRKDKKYEKNTMSIDKRISPYDSRTLLDILSVYDQPYEFLHEIKIKEKDPFVYEVKVNLRKSSLRKKLFLWQLFEYGFKKDDINELIDDGILDGQKLPDNPIEIAKIVFSSRYWNSDSYREKIRSILRKNWDKALETHKRLLETDKEYREKTVKNLMAAVKKRKKKTQDDPEYKEYLADICRKNISIASKTLKKKLNTDEEFRKHMLETRRKNIQKGRRKRLKYYELRKKELGKILSKEDTVGVKQTLEILMEKYPEFLKRYYRSKGITLYNVISKDIRSIKGKQTKEEKRKVFARSERWKRSIKKAREASVKKKLESVKPRRKLLSNFILKKYGTLDIPISNIIADIDKSEIRNYYIGIKDIYHSIKRDVNWIKENL